MRGFKRSRPQDEPEVSVSTDVRPQVPREIAIPMHIERTLIALTSQLQAALERVEHLEVQVEELNEHATNSPSHSDVLEVRMHGAKLAAELARSTVELRGEIGMATDEARRATRAALNALADAERQAPVEQPEAQVDENEAEVGQSRPHPFSASA